MYKNKGAKKSMKPWMKAGLLAAFGIGLCFLPNEALASTSAVNTGMPWDTGVNKMFQSLTGPLAQAASGISIATGGAMWMMGAESQVTKLIMRCALGSGVALAAPSAVSALSGTTIAAAGCLL